MNSEPFDPYAILGALERQRVSYVLIGAFARVIQGTDEATDGVDLAPSLRPENLHRLGLALDTLAAERLDSKPLALDEGTIRDEPLLHLRSRHGELKIVPEPAGTRGGSDDLRRAATRQPLGRGLRPNVASIGDLARMSAALARPQDLEPLQQLRTLADLERHLHRGIDL